MMTTEQRWRMPEGKSRQQPVFVIDSREQQPYGFSSATRASVRRALPAGDYSIAGFETQVAVERKTLDDLVSTVIWSRERFHRELERLQTYAAAYIVVEADLTDMLLGRYRSKAYPSSVMGSVIAIIVDFGIPVFFCSNRERASQFVERYLLRCHKQLAGE